MTRHSKNNCALGHFTHAEKQKLKNVYGTVSQRLGGDSMRKYDACCLCLNTAISPVICTKGHLFCKECILSNIMSQKKDLSTQEQSIKAQNALVAQQEQQISTNKSVEEQNIFKSQSSIVTAVKEAAKPVANLDLFWTRVDAHQSKLQQLPIPKLQPMCNAGNEKHPVSFKKLIAVKFNGTDEKSCGVCIKAFKNGSSIVSMMS
jgi:nitric oxide synthase-interacting protein